jgi:hypothetical protein
VPNVLAQLDALALACRSAPPGFAFAARCGDWRASW